MIIVFSFIPISIFVSLATFKLSHVRNIGAVNASALVTLFSVFVIYVIENMIGFKMPLDVYEYLVFGASFVGMSAGSILSRKKVIIASVLYALTFSFITPYLSHLGGALGFSAFIAVLAVKKNQFKAIG